MDNGWSVDNVILGCGGGLLQKHNRDSLKFAFKCSYAVVDGEGIEGNFFERLFLLIYNIIRKFGQERNFLVLPTHF
jgi:hypothetical protein